MGLQDEPLSSYVVVLHPLRYQLKFFSWRLNDLQKCKRAASSPSPRRSWHCSQDHCSQTMPWMCRKGTLKVRPCKAQCPSLWPTTCCRNASFFMRAKAATSTSITSIWTAPHSDLRYLHISRFANVKFGGVNWIEIDMCIYIYIYILGS